MPWRTGVALLVLAVAAPAQSVGEIVGLVRASMHEPDQKLAKTLHKLKPAERLDEHTIEELESEGAGPHIVTELERLREISESKPVPAVEPVFPHPAAPAAQDQRGIIEDARRIALRYAESLPNFLCAESVKRYMNSRGSWDLKDTLELTLTFFEQQEDYKLQSINGRGTVLSYESAGGAISRGEFGSILRQLFEPRFEAVLQWDHWTTLRRRPAHVYSFQVLREKSRYNIEFGIYGRFHESTAVGQHGLIYVDHATHEILRIIADADGIPARFSIRSSRTQVDYDFVDISGHKFLLPLRAEIRMETRDVRTRNEVRFYNYRKFGSDTTISFEETDGPPPKKR